MSKSFGLPQEIMSLIFQYDNTYKNILSREVITKIWGAALKRSIRLYSLNTQMYWNCSDDDIDIDDIDIDVLPNKMVTPFEIEQGTVAVKFAVNYLYANMGFYDNHLKGDSLFGIGDQFEPHELCATCIKLSQYIFIGENEQCEEQYERIPYFHIDLQFKDTNHSIFVYNNVDEGKVNSMKNNNLIQQYYDPDSRTALVLDVMSDDYEGIDDLIIEHDLNIESYIEDLLLDGLLI